MRDHTKLRAFELADELVISVYRISSGFPKEERLGFLRNEDSSSIEPKIIETEKVLNGLIQSLRRG